ncbi:MAG: hypothetical protein WCF72_20610, partial [Pseudolabrys sp.]
MFALRTFKRALIVVGLVGGLDASEPHRASTFWAWRQISRLRRIIHVRLWHGGLLLAAQAGARFVTQPPTPWTELLS